MLCHYLERSYAMDLTTDGERLRDWFTKTDFDRIDPYPNHTHGESASKRTVGSNFIEYVSNRAVGEPFYFQGSAADVRRGRQVSREWYWAKDLSMFRVPPPSHLGKHQVCAMVDVDEYVDMPQLLAVNFCPYLLYTFVPDRAGKSDGDRAYRFIGDGKVEYVVSGGGTYEHYVWDYNHDSLCVTGTEWLWLGHGLVFPVRVAHTAYYKVERRNVDGDHQVVCLAPMKRWTTVIPWETTIIRQMVKAPELTRFNPVIGDFVRVQVKTADGLMVSTARVGDFSSSLVPASVDEEASIKSSLTKDALTIAMVKASMDSGGVDDLFGAEVMTAYHRQHQLKEPARVFTTSDGVRAYQFLPKLADYDPDAQPSMKSFMRPLVVGFCPAITKGNEMRAVDKRVKEVKSNVAVTPFLLKAIDAFVELLSDDISKRDKLIEVDEDEVWEKQHRPSQRAILRRADYLKATGTAQVFGKRQAETKIQDLRLITPIDGCDKRDYSRFIYALADALKKTLWYASGKTPLEVATRVSQIAAFAQWLLETDFSRMDGRISPVLRELEERLMHRLFHPSMHARMERLMKNQTFLHCRTKFGVHYNSGTARGSGSPETSAFNSVATAFCFFLAHVLDGLDYGAAYKNLCEAFICLGDDGVCARVSSSAAVKAAGMIGQKLTVSVRRVGDTVSFLSRHYGPNVWFGSADSCCDLKRQLSKFHEAVAVENNSKARSLKLCEKAFAFFLTDENTPVLGEFVKRVLHFRPVQHGEGKGAKYTNILSIWNSEIPKESQYPSLPDDLGWKLELLEQQLPDFCVSRFSDWLQHCNSLEDLMDAPEPIVLEAVHPGGDEEVVVDGDVLKKPSNDKTRRGTRGGKTRRRSKKNLEQAEEPRKGTNGKTGAHRAQRQAKTKSS